MATRLYLFFLLTFCAHLTFGQTTYFQQNFSAGGTTASYINTASPSVGQFTDISSGTGLTGASSATIGSNYLEVNRPTGSSGQVRFCRASDFAPTPPSLYIQFSIDISTIDDQSSAAFFYVGGNKLDNSGSTPANADLFAKLSICFAGGGAPSNTDKYYLRDTDANKNTPNYTGKTNITWVLNKTGGTLTYVAPGGGKSTVANNKYDLWVNNTNVFDDYNVLTAAINLQRIKLLFNNGTGKIRFGDFLIRDVAGVLPVKLVTFQAKPQGKQVQLNWATAWERDASHFVVERGHDLNNLVPIGQVKAMGNTDQQMTYTFIDERPMPGANYYRLVQVDTDNKLEQSKIVAAVVNDSQPGIDILGNPIEGNVVRFSARNLPEAGYRLLSPSGNDIPCQLQSYADGTVQLTPLSTLPAGIYTLQAVGEDVRLSKKVLVR
ncbi:hypothetical protein GCM10023187_49100 [Nibrella viscosa]|uniref:Por secretion system C-terminal sorting domain-containing protein n=1 Tax=Nibrella viscosa TaxID=1084524 RepID=A0ABP8KWK9_9BACT